MVINTMVYMLILGIFGLLRLRARQDRMVSWLMLIIISVLFCEYNIQNSTGVIQGLSVLWGKSQIGNITIDFHPSQITNQIIIPLFFISLLAIINNNIFRYEEKRSPFNAFVIFNLIAVSLLICAENYVQLITVVFAMDIFGYLILKDVDSSRRYVIYNFFADMCIYMILALACGKIQSLDISKLLGYEQIGRHKDFVSLVMMTALFIKIGCFPFQGALTDISHARFQRMSIVNLMFSPLAGILLLLKLHNLLFVSDLFLPIFKSISIITFFAGLSGFIAKRHMQKKIICLNMAFCGLILQLLQRNDFNWSFQISLIYIAIYLFNQLFFKIYLYQNRETDMSKMLNAKEINTAALETLLILVGLINAVFLIMLNFGQNGIYQNDWLITGQSVLLFVGQSIILNHIYLSPLSRKLDYLNPNPTRLIAFILNFVLILIGLYLFKDCKWWILGAIVIFFVSVALPLWGKLKSLYAKDNLQKYEFHQSFLSYVIIRPISYFSRIIWLMMDIFLSEKVITASAASVERSCIVLFLKINRRNYGSYVLFIIIGIMIFVLSYYMGGQK